MALGEVYPRAPITEAVIDLQVEPLSAAHFSGLEKVRGKLSHRYPSVQEQYSVEQTIALGAMSASVNQQKLGYLLTSKDGGKIAAIRLNGFGLSKIAPYLHWDEFRQEAMKLWPIYARALKPGRITRVALRYINRIDVPSEKPVSVSDYITTGPVVPKELPQKLKGFVTQFQLFDDAALAHIMVNQALVPPPAEKFVSILLDIDVSRIADVPQTEQKLWSLFDKLRVIKNAVFEACITDNSRELFR